MRFHDRLTQAQNEFTWNNEVTEALAEVAECMRKDQYAIAHVLIKELYAKSHVFVKRDLHHLVDAADDAFYGFTAPVEVVEEEETVDDEDAVE